MSAETLRMHVTLYFNKDIQEHFSNYGILYWNHTLINNNNV